ncbi:hypothetical protein O7634_22235 [Micromonospora sp. WMMD1120]|uniref:hypothetical protein n=1 Tax=Micromonospora sp. WMMD1120 TaxID=3016106 RepID=UPI0024179C61|nr:hypothetical protein [Micromonospora sp. WMMD1120]MDG4809475.1 hypothetical protein [Micromonospora sp. WMMD1120]
MHCEDAIMRAKVGLLTIGRVSDTERTEVARHLTDCPSCRSEREDIARVVDLLDVLRSAPGTVLRELPAGPSPAVVAPLLLRPTAQQFGVPGAAARAPSYPRVLAALPPAVAARPVPAVIAARPAAPVSRPSSLTSLPPRPATGRLSVGPHSHRRPRRWSPGIAVSSALLVVAVAAGTTVLYRASQADPPGPIVATAASSDASGVDLRAVVRGETDGVGVELTVGGLVRGSSYQVYAATVDDDLRLLGEITGGAGAVRWSGPADLPVDDLAYLSVSEANGAVVAMATVVRDASAPL